MICLSEKLKELRLAKGLSTTELGKELKVSQATISRWENNICLPNTTELYEICIYFKVTPNYLLGFED